MGDLGESRNAALDVSNGYINGESGVNNGHWLRKFKTIGLMLALGVSMSAEAGFLGFGGTSWKEEALLHGGSKIIVTRSVERGGRHEPGQEPPYKEQSLTFTLPGTNQTIKWEDHYSEDIGSSSFMPLAVDISKGAPYLVAGTMGCLSYNKWGRPNPPYVVFKYDGKEWQRISLLELPDEIKKPNLIFSMPDIEVERLGKSFVTAEKIQQIISDYPQPEYRTILREPLPKDRINAMCMEMILYKGYWIMPNDPVARLMVDRKSK